MSVQKAEPSRIAAAGSIEVVAQRAQEVVKDLGKAIDETKGLSPFYWAAFTLAGDWR